MPKVPKHIKARLARKATKSKPKPRPKSLVRDSPEGAKPKACPRCGCTLQKCPKCGATKFRNNSMILEWENNCHLRACHRERLVCAKCRKPV